MHFQRLRRTIMGWLGGKRRPRGGSQEGFKNIQEQPKSGKGSKHGEKSWVRAGQELDQGLQRAAPLQAGDGGPLREFRQACLWVCLFVFFL